jgi:hypothetical protein
MRALGELAEQSRRDPFTQVEIDESLVQLKNKYGFTELSANLVGENWQVRAAMNPFTTREILAEHKEVTEPSHLLRPPAEEGLEEITRLPVHDHHLLPEQFKPRFENLADGRIDINLFIITIDEAHHLGVIHGYNQNGYNEWERNWNGIWGGYFREKNSRGEPPTKLGVYRKLLNMMRGFGLTNFEVHRYRNVGEVHDLREMLQ